MATISFEMARRAAIYRPPFNRPEHGIKAGDEVRCFVLGIGPYQIYDSNGETYPVFVVELLRGKCIHVDPDHIQFTDTDGEGGLL